MLKPFILCGLFLLPSLDFAASSFAIKDNSDLALTLSQANYNRLVVKNDKIVEAVFPPSAMGIKRDEQDGSVYLMLAAATQPFTLFLTTETGRHFSLTVSAEESLGKTIELIPQQATAIASKTPAFYTPKNTDTKMAALSAPEPILSLISQMEKGKPLQGVQVSHQYGKAERWQKGLTLLPKESWQGIEFKGEIIELYNGGKEPLELSEAWFANADVKAIKFSKPRLLPHESAMLYRVQGATTHG